MPPTDPKPGYTTTEFWTTLFVHLLALIALGWTFSGHTLNTDKYAAAVPAFAFLASGISQLAYSQARAKTKAAHVQALSSWVTDVSPGIQPAVTQISNAFTTHVDSVGSDGGGISSSVLAMPTQTSEPSTTITSTTTVGPATDAPSGANPLAGLEGIVTPSPA